MSSTGSTKRGKHAGTTARHVARLIAVVHQLTHATMLRRNYDLEQKAISMCYDMPAPRNSRPGGLLIAIASSYKQ